jgi:hypothetical protein
MPTRHHIAANLRDFVLRYRLGPISETWNHSYLLLTGDNRYPPGVSIEWAFPLQAYVDALDAILAKLRELHAQDMSCAGPVSLRFVGASDAMLAITHGGPRATIEVLAACGASTVAMHHGDAALSRLTRTAAAKKLDGRPHWGQQLPTSLAVIAGRYAAYPRWKAARDALDPLRLFTNLAWP